MQLFNKISDIEWLKDTFLKNVTHDQLKDYSDFKSFVLKNECNFEEVRLFKSNDPLYTDNYMSVFEVYTEDDVIEKRFTIISIYEGL